MCQDENAPIPTPSRPRRIWRIARWPLLAIVLGFVGLCVTIDVYGQQEHAQPAQAIVVLGARVSPDGRANSSLRGRSLRAAELYHQGLAPVIICSGGQGADEPRSEASTAAEILRAQGVPAEAILLEDRSSDTRENALFTAAICREHGWSQVVVVSDPYHLFRARRNFARAGLQVTTSPALRVRRNVSRRLRVLWTAREGVAILRDLILPG